ncbi:MAG: NfeD family protein [Thermoplasmatota archaeon]
MRGLGSACLLTLLLVTSASAQMLTDPVGDVTVATNGQGVPFAPATAVDLAALNVSETPDGFRFAVKVADLGSDEPRADAGSISVTFVFDNVTFRADFYRSFDNAAYFGGLYDSRDGTDFHWIRQTSAFRDLPSATVWQDVAREDLVGATGKAQTLIAPRGIAYAGGETWSARSRGVDIRPGSAIRVVGAEGLELIVEPAAEGGAPATPSTEE